jgi:hypothetical protein
MRIIKKEEKKILFFFCTYRRLCGFVDIQYFCHEDDVLLVLFTKLFAGRSGSALIVTCCESASNRSVFDTSTFDKTEFDVTVVAFNGSLLLFFCCCGCCLILIGADVSNVVVVVAE